MNQIVRVEKKVMPKCADHFVPPDSDLRERGRGERKRRFSGGRRVFLMIAYNLFPDNVNT